MVRNKRKRRRIYSKMKFWSQTQSQKKPMLLQRKWRTALLLINFPDAWRGLGGGVYGCNSERIRITPSLIHLYLCAFDHIPSIFFPLLIYRCIYDYTTHTIRVTWQFTLKTCKFSTFDYKWLNPCFDYVKLFYISSKIDCYYEIISMYMAIFIK